MYIYTYIHTYIHTYAQPLIHITLLLPYLKSDYLIYYNPSCCPLDNRWPLADGLLQLRYLKATKDYRITYTSNSTNYISSYYDSDYTSDILLTKSTLGYIFILTSSPIS